MASQSLPVNAIMEQEIRFPGTGHGFALTARDNLILSWAGHNWADFGGRSAQGKKLSIAKVEYGLGLHIQFIWSYLLINSD